MLLSNSNLRHCIKNCVATAFFGTPLDLEEISWKKYGEFNPLSFAAAKFRLKTPSTTALITLLAERVGPALAVLQHDEVVLERNTLTR